MAIEPLPREYLLQQENRQPARADAEKRHRDRDKGEMVPHRHGKNTREGQFEHENAKADERNTYILGPPNIVTENRQSQTLF
jgi:hypothetical protein